MTNRSVCAVHRSVRALLVATLVALVDSSAELVLAQEPVSTLDLLKEEEIVSIATRYEQPISQAPSNVYVITDEDIRHSAATDLPTVLRRVPGLEVMQMTGGEFNVSARGNNQALANKMLVLVDGRSVYLDVQGNVYWKALPVTLPEIKRVEVLKGPASAIYGFNAFDGVINIITKTAEEMRGTTVQVGAGDIGAISSAAVHADTIGQFGYRLSVGHDQQGQWRNHDGLAFRSNKLNLDGAYALSNSARLRIAGGVTDVNRFDGTTSEIVSNAIRPTMGYSSLAYEQGALVVRAWWSLYSDESRPDTIPSLAPFVRVTDRNGAPVLLFTAHTYNLDVHHTLDLGAGHRVQYGANYRHNTLTSSVLDASSRENRLGLFVQDDWRITKTLSMTAGARYNLHSEIHGTISPRVALIYQPVENHTFRTSFSMAYRPPTLFESHADQRLSFSLPPPLAPFFPGSLPIRGTPNLCPEQIISGEIGYQGWFWNHRLRTRLDVFFNHVNDLIGNLDPRPNAPSFANDRGRSDVYGTEAGVDVLLTRWLSAFANVTYQEINQSFAGTLRRAGPQVKVNAGLRGEWDNGVSADATVHHVSSAAYPSSSLLQTMSTFSLLSVIGPPSSIPGYTLLNARVGYGFWHQHAAAGYQRSAEVALSIFNALNDTHKEHPLGDIIGRRIMGWLTLRY
ncbi:MAG: TonB-dependent receptor [Nitrospiraceae bacterium]